ncbi:MAG: N-acetylneuraminate synthase family protein [Candidatus Scalindua sp.]
MQLIKNSDPYIGDNEPRFIIAEVGLNHNGEFHLALESIKAAANAGANAVKFQNYKTEDFIFDKSLTYTYYNGDKQITESMYDMCKRCEMKRHWLPKLKKVCDDLGLAFISTPTSESGVNDLVTLGVSFLKNGSDYLLHLPLLKYMGTTGIPVIISTGMGDESEIREAVEAVHSGGSSPVILMHCTSSYPTENSEVNLNKIPALREVFGLPVGFSDHTIGSAAAIQAVTLGVSMFEKHFTLNHNLPGPDHEFSITPSELKEYVEDVHNAKKRMGKKIIEPAMIEKATRNELRLGIIIVKDLSAGHIIEEQDFVISKPGTGLPPKEAEKIIGKKLVQDVTKGAPLRSEVIETVQDTKAVNNPIPQNSVVLVAGGAGFIGSHIVDKLLSLANRVIVIDDLSTGKEENINPQAEFYNLNISDYDRLLEVFRNHKIDYVIHQAAKINLNVLLEDPATDIKSSVLGTLNLLKCCVDFKIKKIIYASSVAVYGRAKKLPVMETDELAPIYSYGIAKKCSEEYIRYYCENYGLNYSILRYANVYGPRQPIYGEVGVIAIYTARMLKGEPLVIFGDGGHLRDYIYIDDVVYTTLKAFKAGDREIFNIGCGEGMTVNTVFNNFNDCFEKKLKPVNQPERVGELGNFYTDSNKAKKILGWKAETRTEEGIKRTIEYYRGLEGKKS